MSNEKSNDTNDSKLMTGVKVEVSARTIGKYSGLLFGQVRVLFDPLWRIFRSM